MTRERVFLLAFSLLVLTLMACFPPASCQVTLGNTTPEPTSPAPTAEELEMRRVFRDQVEQRAALLIAGLVLFCFAYWVVTAFIPEIARRIRVKYDLY